jgi:hypothetical protein
VSVDLSDVPFNDLMWSEEYKAYRLWQALNDNEPGRKLLAFLTRLKTYTVRWWTPEEAPEHEVYEPGYDRLPEALPYANVVTSEIKHVEPLRRHVVALDLDHQAYLVPSTTEGHGHLYIDVPGGVAHDDYMALLELLGRIGIIEPGYADVSIKRGHTDLRLPWIKKENPSQ